MMNLRKENIKLRRENQSLKKKNRRLQDEMESINDMDQLDSDLLEQIERNLTEVEQECISCASKNVRMIDLGVFILKVCDNCDNKEKIKKEVY